MSLARIGAVAARVLRQIWHDKRVLAFMLFIPSIAMILFGYSFSGDIRDVRVAVIDEDKTDLTQSIIENLLADPTFTITQLEPGERDLQALLLEEGYHAVIRFPEKFTSLYYAHFAMGVATTAQGTIDLTLDESDPQSQRQCRWVWRTHSSISVKEGRWRWRRANCTRWRCGSSTASLQRSWEWSARSSAPY